MSASADLVGRTYPAPGSLEVTQERVQAFADALGAPAQPVPATFPIVLGFEAMQAFLDAEQIDLHCIVHGEQRFSYVRPLRLGDVLTGSLRVVSVRSMGGADIIATASEFTDASGEVVCTGSATLVHGEGA